MMKIARHLRQDREWAFVVSGPGVEGKKCPSADAALAFAQQRAGQTSSTFYVREHGSVIYRAEVTTEGVVVTFRS